MHRFVVLCLALAALVFAVVSCAQASIILASSTFDTDAEGWTVYGDAQGGSVAPNYNATGGNPDGFISARDDVAGGVWYWNAPTKFLGDLSAAYNEMLSFELKQSATDSQFSSKDIVITGGGLSVYYDTSYNPDTTWTTYSVGLSEAGWKLVSNNAAVTQAQMQNVLASVTELRIRGEYRTGADTGSLDNVVVNAVPEPGSLCVLVTGLAACCAGAIRRRR